MGFTRRLRLTVGGYLDRWLATCSSTLRPTTLSTYRSLVRRHVEPRIGAAQLGRLTPIAIQQLYTDLGVCAAEANSSRSC